jgi:hypothetical protein
MKNYLFLMLLLFSFAACNNPQTNDHTDVNSDSEHSEAAAQQEDQPQAEEPEKLDYRKYNLNQEDNDLSYDNLDKALNAVPQIEEDFAFLRAFVSPIADAEVFSNQEELKGIRMPADFFKLQNVVIKEYDNDFLGSVFGDGAKLKDMREKALKGGDKFERNTDYSIDLYAKMKTAKGDLLYLGTLNEHKDKEIGKRGWYLFYLNEQQQIVSASSFFFSLYFKDGVVASDYFFASNDEPDYFMFDVKDGYIRRIQAKDSPFVVEEVKSKMKAN